MDILNRTFGLEVEMCNVEKAKVKLPAGYSWSADEKIFNTDAQLSSKFGGEVNTPPLTLCQKDREVLRGLYADLVDNGGKIKWSIDTHVHIYAGDLELEQLKRVFYLLYHCYPFVKKYCQIADWDEKVFNAQPLPLQKHYNAVKEAQDMSQLEAVFVNQSKKGYLRMAINVASVFKRNTIEFRCFHATDSFEQVEVCVLASYRMFQFAITHSEEEIKLIASYEEFLSKVKLREGTPSLLVPLIYQGNPYEPKECFLAKPISHNGMLGKALLSQDIKALCVAGNLDLAFPLALYKKVQVSVYSQNPFVHLLRLIALGEVAPVYNDELDFLNAYVDGSAERNVAIAMLVANIRKCIGSKSSKNVALFATYKNSVEESLCKMQPSAEGLITMFKEIEYCYGTLDDALQEKDCILYQFGEEKHAKAQFDVLQKYSNIDLHLGKKSVDFYNLAERIGSDVRFYLFSDSPYLSNFHKIAVLDNLKGKNAGRYLYTNKPQKATKAFIKKEYNLPLSIEEPPADLQITDANKLRICEIAPKYLLSLQKSYIKKVDDVSLASFAYVVMYENFCLGGIGFNLSRTNGIDLWQLSDFCTNNDVPKLSKLILLCIKSKQLQSMLSRKMGRFIESVVTFVYTNKPVSMKYRSEYKKRKDLSTQGRLVYISELGVYLTLEDVVKKYQSLLK